jgi:hypothetical protein
MKFNDHYNSSKKTLITNLLDKNYNIETGITVTSNNE